MTAKETVEKLNALTNNDPEEDHLSADNYLLAFIESSGFPDVAKAFEKARNRNKGFWYS